MSRAVLPPVLLVTDETQAGGRPLAEVVAAAIAGGVRAVLLREKHLPPPTRASLAHDLRALLAPAGGVLLVASDAAIPSDGVHLAASDPMPGAGAVGGRLVGRSCHSSADITQAAEQGCSYATLSPVFLTESKPGYGPALGLRDLGGHSIPVFALGGVDESNAAGCIAAGASGVAVMGAFMRAADPAALARRLCDVVAEVAA